MIKDQNDCIAALKKLRQVREQEKHFKNTAKGLQSKIMDWFRENGVTRVGDSDVVGILQTQHHKKVRMDELRDMYPELIDDFTEETEISFIKTY